MLYHSCPNPKLFVGSVFLGHELAPFWHRLQLTALDRSVGRAAYEHWVFLQKAEPGHFSGSLVAGVGDNSGGMSQAHLVGLNVLREQAINGDYDGFLFLDSDCFPISPDWRQKMRGALVRTEKRFAAPARVENLSVFPHPCVLYTEDRQHVRFELSHEINLLNKHIFDVVVGGDRTEWLPLIRTNRISHHPLLASVYYDLFYHHGCGSRHFQMRAHRAGYYTEEMMGSTQTDGLLASLVADPWGFTAALVSAP